MTNRTRRLAQLELFAQIRNKGGAEVNCT